MKHFHTDSYYHYYSVVAGKSNSAVDAVLVIVF